MFQIPIQPIKELCSVSIIRLSWINANDVIEWQYNVCLSMLMMIWHGFYHSLSMNDKWTMFCINNCNKISGSGVSRKVNIVVIHYYWFGDWPLMLDMGWDWWTGTQDTSILFFGPRPLNIKYIYQDNCDLLQPTIICISCSK